MDNRYAVIDLGTNTFHLLVAEQDKNGGFRALYRKRIFVKLAENGIERIGEAPYKRGFDALAEFKQTMNEFSVDKATAIGTAALRTASNGPEFIETVDKALGIQIKIVPGDREAELIYKGVKQVVDIGESNGMIMDIGGGSVEFILFDQTGVQWAQSFPIGVAVLFKHFHHQDPISKDEIKQLKLHLGEVLNPLFPAIEKYAPTVLVGASGTFDVLQNALSKTPSSPLHAVVEVELFKEFYARILKTNLAERFQDPLIPDSRAELIIVALILVQFILENAPITSISISAYAMKEGILAELLDPNC